MRHMEESDQIRIARATRKSRVKWATALILIGIGLAIAGAITYSIRKQTTLQDSFDDLTNATICLRDPVNQPECNAEQSEHRRAREAKPFLIGGLAGGGGILVLGVILLATAPSVPEPPVAAPPPETPAAA